MTPKVFEHDNYLPEVRHLEATIAATWKTPCCSASRARLRSLWCALFLTSLVATSGCHPFGARSTISDRGGDDWEAPARSAYAMPRQFQTPKDRYKQTTETGASKQPSAEPQNTTSPPASTPEPPKDKQTASSKTDAKPTSSTTTASKPIEPPVADATPKTNEERIDLESAIAVLPPHLQDVLRNQIAATENHTSTKGGVATATPSIANQDSAVVQAAAIAVQTSISDQATQSPAVPTENAVVPAAANAAIAPVQSTPPQITGNAFASASNNEGVVKPAVRASLSDRDLNGPTTAPATPVTPVAVSSPATPTMQNSPGMIQPPPTSASANHASPFGLPSATTPVVAREDELKISNAASQSNAISADTQKLAWTDALQRAAKDLEAKLEQDTGLDARLRTNHELALRLIHLANNDLESALEPIEGMQPAEQEYYRYQLQALYDSSNPEGVPVPTRRWSLVMENQRKANLHLASISNLEVRNAAFCTDVQGYGSCTPFQAKLFKPDQDVLLYCELENVTAEEIRNGFETQLQGSYEIYDSRGNRIADQLLPMEKEVCANARRDYFMVYRIFMPMQIAPGNYEMRVTIEDMKGKKFGQTSLEFQIQK